MTQQTINIGSFANDGTGDSLRAAFNKVNLNFTELYGIGDVETITKVSPPTHSYGQAGDTAGMISWDATYFYFCTANYVNTSTNIWKRTAHGAGTW